MTDKASQALKDSQDYRRESEGRVNALVQSTLPGKFRDYAGTDPNRYGPKPLG